MVLEDVDFGYNSNKIVLHDINMYAQPGQKIAFVALPAPEKPPLPIF